MLYTSCKQYDYNLLASCLLLHYTYINIKHGGVTALILTCVKINEQEINTILHPTEKLSHLRADMLVFTERTIIQSLALYL